MLVLLLSLTGGLLRYWSPERMAIEHFDEGVYASNLFCPPSYAYPARHLYAPPLFPAVLEWALILGGRGSAVMWVNVLAGSLMLPSVWWVARCWFGPAAALASLLLAATSGFHIAFSRMALTDVTLCLWMLWGVYFAWRAILSGTPAAIIAAGLCATLAWWTKYNGWLTLAISGAGLLAWLLTRERAAVAPVLGRWAALATIALLAWSPVVWGLQSVGGYAAVSANHARYFGGRAEWGETLLRQWANLCVFDGVSTRLGLLAAVLLLAWPGLTPGDRAGQRSLPLLSLLAAGGVLLGSPVSLLILGLGSLLLTLLAGHHSAREADRSLDTGAEQTSARRLAVWMLSAWLIGLLVAVPLYHPYPRLSLPWLVPAWLAAGLGLSLAFGHTNQIAGRGRLTARSRHWLVVISLLGWCGSAWWGNVCARSPRWAAWQSHAIWPPIVVEIMERIDESLSLHAETLDSIRGVVYVVGEPGLFFHLAEAASRTGPVVDSADR